MTRLLTLLLAIVPPLALAGGSVLVAWSLLHLSGRKLLPGVEREHTLSALAALLLGITLAGLGATYLLTGGATGYDHVYLAWLAVGLVSGILGVWSGRSG